MNVFKLFVVVIVASCAVLAAQGVERVFEYASPDDVYKIPRHIRYSFTIRNEKNVAVEQAKFWAYAPVKKTPTQWCKKLKTSHPAQVIEDELGNQILQFDFESLAPYEVVEISIQADLLLAEEPTPIPERTRLRDFMLPSRNIESEHADVQFIARELAGDNAPETVKNVYNWVAANVQDVGYLSDDRGALYALQHGKGDCTEFSTLFAALCRVHKVPTRVVGGYICKANQVLQPSRYHNWSEYFDGETWRLADPQNDRLDREQLHYVAMNVMADDIDGNPMGSFPRFRTDGDGLKVRMNK